MDSIQEPFTSKTLAKTAKRIRTDWQHSYHYRPVLLETFVEKDRFQGTPAIKQKTGNFLDQMKRREKLGKPGVLSLHTHQGYMDLPAAT
ncbi:MAG: DUF4338 domain-containing protein [Mariprofundaceae bacterium]